MAVMGFSIKQCSEDFIPSDVLFFRSVVICIILFPFLNKNLDQFAGRNIHPLIGRAVFGTAGIMCVFYNLHHISATAASMLASLNSIFVIVFAWIFLKEKSTVYQLLGIGLAITGALLLGSPGSLNVPIEYFIVGLVGAVLSGIAFVFLKVSTKKFEPLTIVFILSLFSGVFSFASGANIENILNNLNSWLMLVAVSGLLSQWFLTLCYKYLKASQAVTLTRFNVVFLLAIELSFDLPMPTSAQLVSVLLIIVGNIMINQKKRAWQSRGC